MKEYAKKHPHKLGRWTPDSKAHVATMSRGDFAANEKSVTVPEATTVRIEFTDKNGKVTVLKDKIALKAGEVLDGTFMSRAALVSFLESQMEDAKKQGVLFSIHLKATMMKVSDPIIFGVAVRTFFRDVFDKHAAAFKEVGVDPNNGLGDLYAAIKRLPPAKQAEIEADIQACYAKRPALAMVNSDKGITNLHVPSDVIIDASIPPMIRDSGQMWGPDGKLREAKAVIPDHSYAPLYHEAIEHCKQHGAFDPRTMGTVPNVGLMAQQAEEYGSHDKTFQIPAAGTVRVVDAAGHDADRARRGGGRHLARVSGEGRADPRLGEARRHPRADHRRAGGLLARQEPGARRPAHRQGDPVPERPRHQRTRYPHHVRRRGRALLAGADAGRPGHDLGDRQRPARLQHGPVPDPRARHQREDALHRAAHGRRRPLRDRRRRLGPQARRAVRGRGTPPVGLPRRVPRPRGVSRSHGPRFQQRQGEGVRGGAPQGQHQVPGQRTSRRPARWASWTRAGSHFYLAMYWAEALAAQTQDAELQARFSKVAKQLAENEAKIVAELNAAQGRPVDIGGYFRPNPGLASKAMRPSPTFNAIVDAIS